MITDIFLPAVGETMNEARIIRWLKREGESVAKGEPIVEIETDKANIEIESLASGVLRKIVESEGATVPVGKVIGYVADSMSEPTSPQPPPRPSPEAGEGDSEADEAGRGDERGSSFPRRATKLIVSPRARRLADQRSIDLTLLAGIGTGPGGRIVEADVKRFLAHREPAVGVPLVPALPLVPVSRTLAGKVIPLAGMRKTIAERMARSVQTAPHITFDAEINMSTAEAWRARANAMRKEQGASSVSVTALIVKACAWALKRHPWMNASLRGEEIVLHEAVNIGVAVALDEGLIVPVVADAAHKSVIEITDEIAGLTERARSGRLRAGDLTGGTFTVSNLGMFGVDRFTAIINPPEAGILAVGRMVKRIVPGPDDAPVARPMMTVTLSADHRIVDGAVAARFLADIRAGLEDPALLIW
ncbi:MAG: 2-oxo acid dehydrogenase subunit E2 [Chloroflexi bacterium]|nr:2-oxo acid dehydrogenase subunit E2 [Chloroflexota bacterium]